MTINISSLGPSQAIGWVDGPQLSTDAVSFITDSPATIGGPLSTAVATKTAGFTVDATNSVILCDATSNNITAVLPAASTCTGRQYVFKRTDSTSFVVTIDGNGAETINGAATYILYSNSETATVISDGSNWNIIGRYLPIGWGNYRDTAYTSGSPLAVNNAKVRLTCNSLGSTTDETHLPPGSSSFWNASTNLIIPNGIGGGWDLRVDFVADPAGVSDYMELILDIGDGSPDIPIVTRTVTFAKAGASSISIGFPLFAGSTFNTNGGKLFLDTSGSGDSIDIYDIGFTIKRDV